MGLSRDVLTRLLVTDEPDVSERAEGDVLEFEFESDSPEMQSGLGGQHAKLEPIDDEAPQVTPRRESTVAPIEQRKFRVRLLSNGQPAPPDHEEVRPMSVEAMMREQGVDAEHEHRTRRAVVDAQGAKAEYVLTGKLYSKTLLIQVNRNTQSRNFGCTSRSLDPLPLVKMIPRKMSLWTLPPTLTSRLALLWGGFAMPRRRYGR